MNCVLAIIQYIQFYLKNSSIANISCHQANTIVNVESKNISFIGIFYLLLILSNSSIKYTREHNEIELYYHRAHLQTYKNILLFCVVYVKKREFMDDKKGSMKNLFFIMYVTRILTRKILYGINVIVNDYLFTHSSVTPSKNRFLHSNFCTSKI